MFHIRFLKNRKKLSLYLFLSYSLVLLIPTVISIIISFQSSNIVKNQVFISNNAIMSQISKIFDERIEQVKKTMIQIALNSKVSSLISSKDSVGFADNMTYYLTGQELTQIKRGNDFIEEAYIYFKHKDLVISSTEASNKNIIYTTMHQNKEFTFEKWTEIMNSHIRGELIPMPVVRERLQNKAIAYVQSLPIGKATEINATLVIIIDQENFVNILSDIEWYDNSMILAVNSNNENLFSNSDLPIPNDVDFSKLNQQSGSLNMTIEGNKYTILYQASKNNGLKYLCIISDKIFWANMKFIQLIIIVGIIIILLFGSVSVLYFSKTSYYPVKQIIQNINKKLGLNFDGENNEYNYISEAINLAYEQNLNFEKEVVNQNKLLKNHFLKSLLQGKIHDSETIEKNIKFYKLNFLRNNNAVILFDIYDYGQLFEGNSIDERHMQQEMIYFVISNVVEELMEINYLCCMVSLEENLIACMINFSENDIPDIKINLKRILNEAESFISQNFQIYFSISVSEIHEFVGISDAFYEALFGVRQKESDDSEIVFYDELENISFEYNFNSEIEHRLINFIKAGDYENCKKILEQFFNKVIADKPNSEVLSSLKFDIVSVCMKSIQGKEHEGFLMQLKPSARVLNLHTVDAIKNELFYIINQLCEYSLKNEAEKNENKLSKAVIEYIEKNYSDINLGVSTIGYEFHMVPNYLSRQFKNQTGENLKDYINKYRIEKAKQLILNKNLYFADVAKEVGFIDSNAFIRVFKRHEGITPGQYRELN